MKRARELLALALVFLLGSIAGDQCRTRFAQAYPPWSGTGASNTWTSAGSAPILNPYWGASFSAWYVDTQSAVATCSDSNSGTSSGSPLCTVHELLDHRWGCFGAPNACPRTQAATTTVNIQSNMNASDAFSLYNSLEGNSILFKGLTTTATTITIGTFTAQNYSSGTKATITASGQTGAFWTPYVGHLAQDTTRGGTTCYFWIDSDQGTATATISNRLASNTGFGYPPQCTPVNGDSVTVFNTLPSVYVGEYGGFVLFQQVDFKSSLGAFQPQSLLDVIDTSRIDTELFVSGAAPRLTNVFISASGTVNGTFTMIGGVIVPNFPTFGGYTIAGNGAATTLLLGDVLVESTTIHVNGPVTVAGAYFAGAPDLDSYPGTIYLIDGAIGTSVGYTANAQWGPGSLNAKNGAQVWADNASTSMLLTGGYAIDGATTAWSFSGTTYTSGVTVSAANVASNGALLNPKTNSRIASAFTD